MALTSCVMQPEPIPMPTLTASAPASAKKAKPLGGDDVAADDRGVGALLEELDHLPLVLGVAVGGVDDQHVHFLLNEGFGPLAVLWVGGDGRADEQALLFVD